MKAKYLMIEVFLTTTTITKCKSLKEVAIKLERNKESEFSLYKYEGIRKWKGKGKRSQNV